MANFKPREFTGCRLLADIASLNVPAKMSCDLHLQGLERDSITLRNKFDCPIRAVENISHNRISTGEVGGGLSKSNPLHSSMVDDCPSLRGLMACRWSDQGNSSSLRIDRVCQLVIETTLFMDGADSV